MTVVATRNVSLRMRGFLASTMLELAPGVYRAPVLSPAVRDRIWTVVLEWWPHERDASLVMVWHQADLPGKQAVRVLGSAPVDLVVVDGLVLARRQVNEEGEK
jgi:CRISPR-associated protein Cas2